MISSIFQIAASSTLPPAPKLASELWWLLHPNLNTSSTFIFVGLFENASIQRNNKTRCLLDVEEASTCMRQYLSFAQTE